MKSAVSQVITIASNRKELGVGYTVTLIAAKSYGQPDHSRSSYCATSARRH